MRIKKICILIILFILLIYLSLDLKENYTAGYEDYLSQGSGSYSWGSENTVITDSSTYDETETHTKTEYTIDNLPTLSDTTIDVLKNSDEKWVFLYDYVNWPQAGGTATTTLSVSELSQSIIDSALDSNSSSVPISFSVSGTSYTDPNATSTNFSSFVNHTTDEFILVKAPSGSYEFLEDFNQILKYVPTQDFVGSDVLEYKYNSNGNETNIAKITFNVFNPYEEYESKRSDKCRNYSGYLNEIGITNPSNSDGYTEVEIRDNEYHKQFCEEKWQDIDLDGKPIPCGVENVSQGPQTIEYEEEKIDTGYNNAFGGPVYYYYTPPKRNLKIFCKGPNYDGTTYDEDYKNKEDENKKNIYNKKITSSVKTRDSCNNSFTCTSGSIIDEHSHTTTVKEEDYYKLTQEVIDINTSVDKVEGTLELNVDIDENINNTIIDDSVMQISETNDIYKIDSSVNTDTQNADIQDKMIQSCGATVEEAQAALNIVKDESINTNINNSNVFVNTGDNVTITDVVLSSKLDFISPSVDRTCILNKMKDYNNEIQKNLDVVQANNRFNSLNNELTEDQLNNIINKSDFIVNSSNGLQNIDNLDDDNVIKKNVLKIESIFIQNNYYNKKNECNNYLDILDKICKIYGEILSNSSPYCSDRNLINDILNTEEDLNSISIDDTKYILNKMLEDKLNIIISSSNNDISNSIFIITNEFCYNFLDKCVKIE